MKVINLFGGPGTGKSTTAAHLFALLKHGGYCAELAREWPKGPVWDGYHAALEDQVYILGKHHRDLSRMKRGGVEVVVTDAPLLMSLIYGDHMPPGFGPLVRHLVLEFDNINVFLFRAKQFEPRGRLQTESQARALDGRIRKMVADNGVYYEAVADEKAAQYILRSFLGSTT